MDIHWRKKERTVITGISKSIIRLICVIVVIVLAAACQHRPYPVTSAASSFDGTAMSYDVAGSGATAIVFVHCWTCDRTFWDAQFEYFSRDYTVVRLDLAGHGTSGRGRGEYTNAGFSRDVVAVANELELGKMWLVGHSMGGPVSVEAAALLADRVAGVVAVDSFYTGFPIPKTDEEAAAFAKPFEDDFTGTNRKFLETMFLPGADPVKKREIVATFQQANRSMAMQALKDLVRWFRFVAASRLAGLGERLHNVNAAPSVEVTTSDHNITLVPGVGHFVPQMKPQAFNRALAAVIGLGVKS